MTGGHIRNQFNPEGSNNRGIALGHGKVWLACDGTDGEGLLRIDDPIDFSLGNTKFGAACSNYGGITAISVTGSTSIRYAAINMGGSDAYGDDVIPDGIEFWGEDQYGAMGIAAALSASVPGIGYVRDGKGITEGPNGFLYVSGVEGSSGGRGCHVFMPEYDEDDNPESLTYIASFDYHAEGGHFPAPGGGIDFDSREGRLLAFDQESAFPTLLAANPYTSPGICGDMNGDGSVDNDDFGEFNPCITGPGDFGFDPVCWMADIGGSLGEPDGAVDMQDYSVFQQNFGP